MVSAIGVGLDSLFTLTALTQVFAADFAEFEFGIVIGGKDRSFNWKGFLYLIQTVLPYTPPRLLMLTRFTYRSHRAMATSAEKNIKL